jgi:hypothetical protein
MDSQRRRIGARRLLHGQRISRIQHHTPLAGELPVAGSGRSGIPANSPLSYTDLIGTSARTRPLRRSGRRENVVVTK